MEPTNKHSPSNYLPFDSFYDDLPPLFDDLPLISDNFLPMDVDNTPLVKKSLRDIACETLKFSIPEDFRVGLKQLATCLGDAYIGQSELQGGRPEKTLEELLLYNDYIPKELYGQLKVMLSDLKGLSEDSLLETCEKYARNVADNGQHAFAGGFRGSKMGHSGHLVVFEVVLDEDGESGALRICQKGVGINQFHAKQEGDVKTHFSLFYEKKEIPAWILKSPLLYLALMGPWVYQPEAEEEWNSNTIYDFVKNVLPGIEGYSEQFVTPQRSGTCFQKSILCFMKAKMDEKTYDRFSFTRKLATLTRFERDFNPNDHDDPASVARFTAELAEKLCGTLDDMTEIKLFNSLERDTLRRYLQDVAQRMYEGNWKKKPVRETQAGLLSCLPQPKKILESRAQNVRDRNFYYDGIGTELPVKLLFECPREPEAIQKHFEELFQAVHEAKEKGRFIDGVILTSMSLPQLPRLLDNSWDAFSKEQATELVNKLYDLVHVLVGFPKYAPNVLEEHRRMYSVAMCWLNGLSVRLGHLAWNAYFGPKNELIDVRSFDRSNLFPEGPQADTTLNNQLIIVGCVQPLFEDLIAITDKPPKWLNPDANSKVALLVKDYNPMNHNLTLGDRRGLLLKKMIQALRKDIKNKKEWDKRIECWKSGKYFLEAINLKKHEPALNALKKMVRLTTLLNSGREIDFNVLKVSCTKPDAKKQCILELELEQKFFPPKHTFNPKIIQASDYSLVHMDSSDTPETGLARPLFSHLIAHDWLREINEDDHVLVDSSNLMISSLNTLIVDVLRNDDMAGSGVRYWEATKGSSPLRMTLLSPVGARWINELEATLNKSLERKDLLWHARARGALLLAAVVNLTLLRLQQQEGKAIDIQPIHIHKIPVDQCESLNTECQWPSHALLAVCQPLEKTENLKQVWTQLSYEHVAGDLRETLLRHVYKHAPEEAETLGAGINLEKDSDSLFLPHWLRKSRDYAVVTAHLKHPKFNRQKNGDWLSADQTVRLQGNSSWALRGDALLNHFERLGSNWYWDKKAINTKSYYTLDHPDKRKKNLNSYLRQCSKDFIDTKNSLWMCDGGDQLFLEVPRNEKVFSWSNIPLRNGYYLQDPENGFLIHARTKRHSTHLLQLPKALPPQSYRVLEAPDRSSTLVDVPNLGLRFERFKKDGRLCSRNFPGYWVVDENTVPEGEGLPCFTLRNERGDEKLIFPNSQINRIDKQVLTYKWCAVKVKEYAFYVLERTYNNKGMRERLFDGPTAGILYLIRGLLRTRRYDLARNYVNMLGRRDWAKEPMWNGVEKTYMDPLKVEHPKANVLRLRLILQSSPYGNDTKTIKRYYAMYHQLPADWVLSGHEEKALDNLLRPTEENIVKHKVMYPTNFRRYKPLPDPSMFKSIIRIKKLNVKDIFVPNDPARVLAEGASEIFEATHQEYREDELLLFDALRITFANMHSKLQNHVTCFQRVAQKLLAGEDVSSLVPPPPKEISQPMQMDLPLKDWILNRLQNSAKRLNIVNYKNLRWGMKSIPFPFIEVTQREETKIRLSERQRLQRVSKGYRMGSEPEGVALEVERRLSFVQNAPRKRVKMDSKKASIGVIPSARELQNELFILTDHPIANDSKQNLKKTLNEINNSCQLPVSQNKIKKLQNSLKKLEVNADTEWKITDMNNISIALFGYRGHALAELQLLDNQIVELLNDEEALKEPKGVSRQGQQRLGISHAFQWLTTLKKLPQGASALQLLTLLERYAYNSAWIRRLDAAKDSLKDQDLDKLKELLTDVYQPSGEATLATYKLAAFVWQYQTLFRKQQAARLPEIVGMERGYLAKLATGSGKTAVYTPASIEAFGVPLVINLVPDGLVEQQKRLQNVLSRMSEVRTGSITYSRKLQSRRVSPLTKKDEKRTVCLVSTGGDMLRLLLNTLEDYVKQFENSTFIFQSEYEAHLKDLKENAVAIYDEPQLLFEGNREQAYALETCRGLPQERIEVATTLYKLLLEKGIMVRGSKKTLEWTSELAEEIAKSISENPVMRLHTEKDRHFAVKYMLQPSTLNNKAAENWMKQRDALGPDAARALGIARAQIQVYLPFTLSQRYGVKYGPAKGYLEARPYTALDTPAPGNSTHSVIETLLNYTLQMYLIQGLSLDQTASLVGSWRDLGTLGNRRFVDCLGGTSEEGITLESLPYLTKKKQREIFETLAQSPDAAIEYVQLVAAKKIAYSTSKIRVSGSALSAILRKGVAWSATPYNLEGFPLDLQEGFIDCESDLLTIQRLCNVDATELRETNDFRCNDFAKSDDIYAVIDPYAALYHHTNVQAAEKILKGAREQIQRVAFFADDTWKQIDRTGKITPLGKLSTPDPTLFIYYDMSRSTGTHFDLPKKARGIVLVPKGTPYFALAQGCGRLRKWGKGQQVCLLVHKDVNEDLNSFTPEKLIAWTFNNEGKDLQSVIVSMHRDQMDALLLRRLIDNLIALSNNSDGIIKRYKLIEKLRDFIVTEVDLDTFEEVGLTPPTTDKEIIDKHFKKLGSIRNFWTKEDRAELNKIRSNCLRILPKGSTSLGQGNIAMTAETDQEVRVTKEYRMNFESETKEMWSPHKIFTSKAFEPTVVNLTLTMAVRLDKLFLTNVNVVFKQTGFPDNLIVTPMAINRRIDKATKRLVGPNDFGQGQSNLYYESLPKVQHVLRLRFKDSKESQFLLLHPQEAHLVARCLRSEHEFNFCATLLTSDGKRIAGFNDKEMPEDKATPLMLALVQLFNGQCRNVKALTQITSYVAQDCMLKANLYAYLLKRNRHLPVEHLDSPAQSQLAKILARSP